LKSINGPYKYQASDKLIIILLRESGKEKEVKKLTIEDLDIMLCERIYSSQAHYAAFHTSYYGF
jgi:hypothetical protein